MASKFLNLKSLLPAFYKNLIGYVRIRIIFKIINSLNQLHNGISTYDMHTKAKLNRYRHEKNTHHLKFLALPKFKRGFLII